MIDKIKELKVYRDECDEWRNTFDSGWNSAIDEVIKLIERTHNSDYAKCTKCGGQIESPVCARCNFPTYDNTVKKHFA